MYKEFISGSWNFRTQRDFVPLGTVILNQGWFCPQGTFVNIWRPFWLSQPVGGLLRASNRQKLGILLNILRCTGHPPSVKNYPAPKSIVLLLISLAIGQYLLILLGNSSKSKRTSREYGLLPFNHCCFKHNSKNNSLPLSPQSSIVSLLLELGKKKQKTYCKEGKNVVDTK